MTIGERAYKAISDHANQKGVGIVEYAKSIGINQPNLSNWESARSEPRAYLLSLMAAAGLDVHWILTGKRVDKVEVVRCEECKRCRHWGNEWGASGLQCKLQGADVDPDDFCSYGERKGDNAGA